jgi:hypothetical protein
MLKKAVPTEIMCTDTKKCCFESKYVEKGCFERNGATMIKLAREEGVLPRIAKLLSAQTFPAQHFESFGIDTSMMYDKTDTLKNVFGSQRKSIWTFRVFYINTRESLINILESSIYN